MEPVSYEIETEVPNVYMDKLMEFIQKKYLLPQKERFRGIAKRKDEAGISLSYTVTGAQESPLLQVEVKGARPIAVKITPLDEKVTETMIEEAKQDIVIAMEIFEQNARKSTLYFAWREGEKIVPETRKQGREISSTPIPGNPGSLLYPLQRLGHRVVPRRFRILSSLHRRSAAHPGCCPVHLCLLLNLVHRPNRRLDYHAG